MVNTRFRTLLALALLATFVVQAATPREAPLAASPVETLRGVPPDRHASLQAVPGDSGQVHGRAGALRLLVSQQTSTPAAALPSTGAPVSEPAITPEPSGEVGTAIMAGNISWADPELGGDYLATRFPRGTLVEICATDTGICIVRRTNDFGPHAGIRPNRIADLAVLDWEQICRLDRERGLCPGTVEAIEDFQLPATDTP